MYPKEFLEWIRLNCRTSVQVKKGLMDIFWYKIEDEHPWDGEPTHTYNTDELFEHWKDKMK